MIASAPNQCNWGIKPLDNLEITWEQKHMHYIVCRKILDVNMSITLYWIMKTYDEILGTEKCKKEREREGQFELKLLENITSSWQMIEERLVVWRNSDTLIYQIIFWIKNMINVKLIF